MLKKEDTKNRDFSFVFGRIEDTKSAFEISKLFHTYISTVTRVFMKRRLVNISAFARSIEKHVLKSTI